MHRGQLCKTKSAKNAQRGKLMFKELKEINKKPRPFEFYTAEELWADPYISKKMLEYHLNESVDAASRNRRFIDRSASWIIENFNLSKNTSVIDFGCGPGLYTIQFANAGAAVTGIDFSINSLSYAEKKAKENQVTINYVHNNYLNYITDKKFDLITMIMCDFAALSPIQRNSLLQKFHNLLKPNGSIILDVYSLNYYYKKQEQAIYEFNQMDRFWNSDDYYSFLNTFKYEDEKLLLDKYTIFTKKEKYRIYNWIQCFSKEMIIEEFDKAGLRIENFYADVSGNIYNNEINEFAIVAQKK